MLAACGELEVFACLDIMFLAFVADHTLAVKSKNQRFTGCSVLCKSRAAGLLLKGRIESSFQNENFDQITMHSFGGGYLFGEALVINNAKNSPVQVRAVEDCIVLFIDLKVIYHSDIQSPLRVILTENLIKSLARKNLILNQKVRILSRKSLRERILFYLGTLPKDKNGWVKIPFNKTVLAEYLGVNRSALSRELGRMQDEEILISDGRKMKTLV